MGNRADLALSAANPLEDLSTLRKPLGIMAKGKWYSQADLQTLLDQVAEDTGGRTFPLVSLDKLPDVGVEIARELRNEYVLGYSPSSMASDGKFHRVNLKLARPDADNKLRAYYRQGYYAPGQ